MLLTVHGNTITLLGGSLVLVLNGQLRVISSLGESVSEDAPLVGLPVICNRLDQVTLIGAHSNPKRGNTSRTLGNVGKDKSRSGLADPGARANGTSAKGRAHSSVGSGDGDGREHGKDLVGRRHVEGLLFG